MERTRGERASRRSGRESGRGGTEATEADVTDGTSNTIEVGEDNGAEGTQEDYNATDMLAAALLGAAVGAGLGLLATKLVESDDVRDHLIAARRGMGRNVRRGLRAARQSVGRAAAVKEYAEKARAAFEDALEREVRDLRRAARRRRRKFGF